ncbi:LOW QUALITY PROTEIN: uncharacterized protein C1orf100 homolog [Athene cunicularia]|uniref:LOW QUALITY PROTEIN: uncharacterized protein C1orf100 homolog n=1 Tax=Athene cunicularia TaxID=194338 RepID=UPI000EF69275|nr:LOW QUALITY PROTEIN: uncharacterized protein C1orf100 homolog [Athene cunicularia]
MRAFEVYTRRQEFGMSYSAKGLIREFIDPAPILQPGFCLVINVIPLFICKFCTGTKIFLFHNCHIKTIAFPQLGRDSCSLVSYLYLHYLLFACFISSGVHPGKDVCGFYPGQLGGFHKAPAARGAPGPFSKLQPASVNYEAETPFQPESDNSVLRKYMHFQNIMKKTTSDWYNQTFHKAAFDLSYLNTSHESKYTPKDPGPHIIWTSTGRKMFSTFQACT